MTSGMLAGAEAHSAGVPDLWGQKTGYPAIVRMILSRNDFNPKNGPRRDISQNI